ncbi:MAG: hypothetical protein IKH11_07515 [Bacteroidales bacterium]|nr:hypothetical protein [Bacteroidales bacterium]
MNRAGAIFLTVIAVAVCSCDADVLQPSKAVQLNAITQSMPEYSPEDTSGNGLEDMPDDGQGTIYF